MTHDDLNAYSHPRWGCEDKQNQAYHPDDEKKLMQSIEVLKETDHLPDRPGCDQECQQGQ